MTFQDLDLIPGLSRPGKCDFHDPSPVTNKKRRRRRRKYVVNVYMLCILLKC